jgi:hypothetical protein
VGNTKRKLKYGELTDHVTQWAAFRLEDLQEMARGQQPKTLIAMECKRLIMLMEPIDHDDEDLINWAKQYIDEWSSKPHN